MVWITLTEWRVRQPHRKDATNEKKFVLLDSGTEHHGSSPLPSLRPIRSPWCLPSGMTAWYHMPPAALQVARLGFVR